MGPSSSPHQKKKSYRFPLDRSRHWEDHGKHSQQFKKNRQLRELPITKTRTNELLCTRINQQRTKKSRTKKWSPLLTHLPNTPTRTFAMGCTVSNRSSALLKLLERKALGTLFTPPMENQTNHPLIHRGMNTLGRPTSIRKLRFAVCTSAGTYDAYNAWPI